MREKKNAKRIKIKLFRIFAAMNTAFKRAVLVKLFLNQHAQK
jgi:hypothetical protein